MDSTRQVVDVELNKSSVSDPLGFRLQGGYDFPNPLSVQRVSSDSLKILVESAESFCF